MILLAFFADRLKEPSSYAGLGAFLGAAGIHIDDTVLQATIQLLVSIAGLIAVLVPEKHPSHPNAGTNAATPGSTSSAGIVPDR